MEYDGLDVNRGVRPPKFTSGVHVLATLDKLTNFLQLQ